MGFNVYQLTEESKALLLEIFPAKYQDVIADHITHEFGVSRGTPMPEAAFVNVLGCADDDRGLQALIVEVDGKRLRSDGKPYHITWSLDSSRIAPAEFNQAPIGAKMGKPYRAAHSSVLVASEKYCTFLVAPIAISVFSRFLESS